MAGKKLLNRMEIKKKTWMKNIKRPRNVFPISLERAGVGLVSLFSGAKNFFSFSIITIDSTPTKILLHLKKPTNDEWCVRPGVSLSLPHEETSLPPSSIGGGKALKSRKNLFFQVRMNPPSHLRYPPKKTDPPPSSPSSDIHYNPMYFS